MGVFESELDEARAVAAWHLFSDKTTDPKPSDMTIEEAEDILYRLDR